MQSVSSFPYILRQIFLIHVVFRLLLALRTVFNASDVVSFKRIDESMQANEHFQKRKFLNGLSLREILLISEENELSAQPEQPPQEPVML